MGMSDLEERVIITIKTLADITNVKLLSKEFKNMFNTVGNAKDYFNTMVQFSKPIIANQKELARQSKAMKPMLEDAGVRQMSKDFNTALGPLMMTNEQFVTFNEGGGRLTNTIGKLMNKLRLATQGLKGFRMELLSTMFFGMGVQRVMMGLLTPALQMAGVFDLISTVLGIFFLPIALFVLDVVLWLTDKLLAVDENTRFWIGAIVLVAAALGGLLMLLSAVGLGLGGLFSAGVLAGIARFLTTFSPFTPTIAAAQKQLGILGRVIQGLIGLGLITIGIMIEVDAIKKPGINWFEDLLAGVSTGFGLVMVLKAIFGAAAVSGPIGALVVGIAITVAFMLDMIWKWQQDNPGKSFWREFLLWLVDKLPSGAKLTKGGKGLTDLIIKIPLKALITWGYEGYEEEKGGPKVNPMEYAEGTVANIPVEGGGVTGGITSGAQQSINQMTGFYLPQLQNGLMNLKATSDETFVAMVNKLMELGYTWESSVSIASNYMKQMTEQESGQVSKLKEMTSATTAWGNASTMAFGSALEASKEYRMALSDMPLAGKVFKQNETGGEYEYASPDLRNSIKEAYKASKGTIPEKETATEDTTKQMLDVLRSIDKNTSSGTSVKGYSPNMLGWSRNPWRDTALVGGT